LWNGDERFKIKKMSPKSNGQFELADKGISLTKQQWEAFKSKLNGIQAKFAELSTSSVLENNESVPFVLTDNKYVSVSKLCNDMHTNFQVLVDFRIFYTRTTPISPTKWGIALKHHHWEKLKEIIKEEQLLELMKSVFVIILEDDITTAAMSGSYGCTVTHPSQKQHMDGGCMFIWEDQVDRYIDDCFKNISTDKVVSLFQEKLQQEGLECDVEIEELCSRIQMDDVRNAIEKTNFQE